MNYKIELDPDFHTYKVNGIVKLGVTEIISPFFTDFSHVPDDILWAARELGDDVHEMLKLYDRKNLDAEWIVQHREDLYPYLECWQKVLSDYKVSKFKLIEKPLYSVVYNYCGTLDRWFDRTQLEIKTGIFMKDYEALQTVGYDGLLRENLRISRTKKTKRIAIHLEPDNPKLYTLHEFTDPRDFNDFISCQNVFTRQRKMR